MKILFITLIILCLLFIIYFLFALFITININKVITGQRGKDPDNPCYLQYKDYQDVLNREQYEMTFNKAKIRGYIYTDKRINKFKGFIILSHGFFGTHIQYLLDISLLAKNGYKVLAYDQYGNGLSEGKNQKSLATGIYLLDKIITDVEQKKLNKNLPLILYGHSWGGYSVIGALKNHPEIYKCVSRSGIVSPLKATSNLFKIRNPKLYKFVGFLISFCSYLIYGFKGSLKSTSGLKKNHKTKTLIIYADNDNMVNKENSLAYYYLKHPQDNVEVFITKLGKHNSILLEAGQENYHKKLKEYKELLKKNNYQELQNFTNSLNRISLYPYNEEVSNKILSFLN